MATLAQGALPDHMREMAKAVQGAVHGRHVRELVNPTHKLSESLNLARHR
jgi:hypothetical protein